MAPALSRRRQKATGSLRRLCLGTSLQRQQQRTCQRAAAAAKVAEAMQQQNQGGRGSLTMPSDGQRGSSWGSSAKTSLMPAGSYGCVSKGWTANCCTTVIPISVGKTACSLGPGDWGRHQRGNPSTPGAPCPNSAIAM